jgi:hypothetical protein
MIIQFFSIFEAFQEQKWTNIKKLMKENEKDIFMAVSSQADVIRNSIVRSSLDGSHQKTGRNIDLILKELDIKVARVHELEIDLS